jgi:UDP-glucose 4-epimerase
MSILQAMLAGREPVVADAGTTGRDLIYVADVVHANLLAADSARLAGRVFNIGSGRPTTLLQVVKVANALLGTSLSPAAGGSLAVPPLGLADMSLAEARLGFCASIDLEHGLRQCLAYFKVRHDPAAARLKPHGPLGDEAPASLAPLAVAPEPGAAQDSSPPGGNAPTRRD